MQTETTQERTKVCALDLSPDIIEYLKQRFDVYEGSLGEKVRASYTTQRSTCNFLLNYNLPDNIHEYDVFIEDMLRDSVREYNKDEHTISEVESETTYCFTCSYPQTIFNPIPAGCSILANDLKIERTRPVIKVVFLSEHEYVTYNRVERYHTYNNNQIKATNYTHLPDFNPQTLHGTSVKLCDNKVSARLFQSFLSDIRYSVSFQKPWTYDENNQRIDDPNFIPLLQTTTGAIVSFVWFSDHDIVIGLPQTSKKLELLKVVFEDILFAHFSEYFPEVAESAWVKNPEYYLPGQSELIQQKEALIVKYESEIAEVEKEIESNNSKYEFLHKLLTATGDELVKATIRFFQWLGFTNVIDKDTALDKNFNEEDIQIDLGNDDINGIKLLVIEVKGIGGTSTDSQCSQIAKVVHRRGKERAAYDVHGLYIVNNEMHKAPLVRTIPPFDETKIDDAENDDRGLCYTWQLFNLYFNIEAGVITKEQARKAFFEKGLLQFPTLLKPVGTPHNYYKQHTIACLKIDGTEIKTGDYFYFCKDDRWHKVQILTIQDNGQSFNSVTSGSYGFGLDGKVPNNLPLYIKS